MKKLIFITFLLLGLMLPINASAAAAPKEPQTRTVLSSPPVVYGDTYDIGTFHPRVEPFGFVIENYGKDTLVVDRVVCSVPDMKCKVLISNVDPDMIVGGYIKTKTMKPIGKFKATVKVYWKGYDKPTEFYVTGNCVK